MARGRQMRMPTVMAPQHTFSLVPRATIERSVFDRSHGHKTTFNAGLLIPIFVDEALPGDTHHVQMHALVRLTTPLKPLMDNMYLDSFWFFVPYRLVWTDWVKFCGEQTNPGDSTSFTIPVVNDLGGGASVVGTLQDYFGLPLTTDTGGNTYSGSALPFRAYNLIYNQWFRDENMINSATVNTGDGPDTIASGIYTVRRRGKRHDYFTACLPFLQKGTAQTAGLAGIAPVTPVTTHAAPTLWNVTTGTSAGNLTRSANAAATAVNIQNAGVAAEVLGWNATALQVDISQAVGQTTINALRQAFQIQKLLERDARGGSRYTEIVRAHFGVISPDARLQRAEYLGGGSTPIIISPIAQNSGTSITGQATPQGNLSAIGFAAVHNHGFVKSFTEHGVLMGLVCVRADLTYQQGLERQWSRSTRYDFYWPALAHIGEQAVLNQEIFLQGNANDTLVFGYQERYAEYRYKPSRITGQFRSTFGTPLDIWHLSQKFTALPTLNQTFIEENPPISRVVAVTTEPQFYFDSYIQMRSARPMPVYGVPGLIDHF